MIKKKKRLDSPFIFQTFVIQDCFNNVSFTNVYRMVLLKHKMAPKYDLVYDCTKYHILRTSPKLKRKNVEADTLTHVCMYMTAHSHSLVQGLH
jgi:hypothetical protein